MQRYKFNTERFLSLNALVWPLIVGGISATLLTFVDRLYYLNYNHIVFSACIPAGILYFTFTYFFNSIFMYTTVFFSKLLGQNSQKDLNVFFWGAIVLAVFFGVIIIGLIPIGDAILTQLIPLKKILELGKIYFTILTSGAIFSFLNTVFVAYYTSIKKTKLILKTTVVVNIINVALSYVLIFGLKMVGGLGIVGGAISTPICNLIILSIYITHVLKWKGNISKPVFNLNVCFLIVKKGIIRSVYNTIDLIGWTYLLIIISHTSVVNLVANNIAYTFERLCYMPIFALSQGFSSLISHSLGAKEKLHIRINIIFDSLLIAIAYVVIITLLSNLVGEISHYFILSDHGKVKVEYGLAKIIICYYLPIFLSFNAVNIILAALVEAYGYLLLKFIVIFFVTIFLFIPISTVLIIHYKVSLEEVWVFVIAISIIYSISYYLISRNILNRKNDDGYRLI